MQGNSLTVKWVQQDGGASWFPTDMVSAVPVRNEDLNYTLPQGTMTFIDRVEFSRSDMSDVRASIDSGTVYILNAAGKTIDTIHLTMKASRGHVAPEVA